MSDNRRKYTRVSFQIHAEMEYEGTLIGGHVTDLSMKGLFVHATDQVALGDMMDVTLRLPSTVPPLEFRFRASVARLAPNGFGMEIVESELQSFTHLRNIVAMQVGDSDHVLDELLSNEKA